MMAHTLWSVLLSISEQIHLLYITVSLTEFFSMRHQSLSFIRSWSQSSWVLPRLKSRERGAEGREEKAVGKNMSWNPLHNLLKNQLNTWSELTVFIDLILGTKKIKDRRTPTSLHNNYWGPAVSGAFGTLRSGVCHSPSIAPTATGLFMGGSKKQELVKELRFS